MRFKSIAFNSLLSLIKAAISLSLLSPYTLTESFTVDSFGSDFRTVNIDSKSLSSMLFQKLRTNNSWGDILVEVFKGHIYSL